MDIFLYFIGAIIIISWSFWLYIIWQKRAGLSESSPFRFIMLFLPVTCFLLISISGWSSVLFLRIDIMGFVFFFLLIIITWLFQFFTFPFEISLYRRCFIISVIFNVTGSLAIVCFVYILKSYPLTGISISAFFRSFENVKGLEIFWYLLNPDTNKQDTSSLATKLLITLCTYLPLTLVRMWYTNSKFKQLRKEIDELKELINKDKH